MHSYVSETPGRFKASVPIDLAIEITYHRAKKLTSLPEESSKCQFSLIAWGRVTIHTSTLQLERVIIALTILAVLSAAVSLLTCGADDKCLPFYFLLWAIFFLLLAILIKINPFW